MSSDAMERATIDHLSSRPWRAPNFISWNLWGWFHVLRPLPLYLSEPCLLADSEVGLGHTAQSTQDCQEPGEVVHSVLCMSQHMGSLLVSGLDPDRVRVLGVVREVGLEGVIEQPVKRSGGSG